MPLAGNGDRRRAPASALCEHSAIGSSCRRRSARRAGGRARASAGDDRPARQDFNEHDEGAAAARARCSSSALAFVLLLATFRSVVIPLTAIGLNLLSVGAAYGILVADFPAAPGREHPRLDLDNGGIVTGSDCSSSSILFGLSMDYHVLHPQPDREELRDVGGRPRRGQSRRGIRARPARHRAPRSSARRRGRHVDHPDSARAGRLRTSARVGRRTSAASARFIGDPVSDSPAGRSRRGRCSPSAGVEAAGTDCRAAAPERVGRARRRRGRSNDGRPTVAVAVDLRADDLDPGWFAGCDRLHLPGYSLMRSPIDGAALRACAERPRRGGARERRPGPPGAPSASFGAARLMGAARAHLAGRGSSATRRELDALGGEPDVPVLVDSQTRRGPGARCGGPGRALSSSRRCPQRSSTRPVQGTRFAAGFLLGRGLPRRTRPAAGSRPQRNAFGRIPERCRDGPHRGSPTRWRRRSRPAGAVVALETTLVAHGFPHPEGAEVGRSVGGRRFVRQARSRPPSAWSAAGSASGCRRGRSPGSGRPARRRGSSAPGTSPRARFRAPSAGRDDGGGHPSWCACRRHPGDGRPGGLEGCIAGFPAPPDVSADLRRARAGAGDRRGAPA